MPVRGAELENKVWCHFHPLETVVKSPVYFTRVIRQPSDDEVTQLLLLPWSETDDLKMKGSGAWS